MIKKGSLFLLCLALLSVCCFSAAAAHVTPAEAIGTLETLGLLQGTGEGFEPDRSATRAEATVMLLRLLGMEQDAVDSQTASPFDDGGWADAYLGYAFAKGLVKGTTQSHFDSERPVSAVDFITMTLRALGYTEGSDFTWKDSRAFADRIGLAHGEYTGTDVPFLREDLALISYTALTLHMKDSGERLIEHLYHQNSIDAEALKQTRFADIVNLGRSEYTAAELHEMTGSAILAMRMYETEDMLEQDYPDSTGTAFLISPDGLAVMCWHELDDMAFLRATTTDGRDFPVEGILDYDVFWDIALIRLSMTDTEGNSVRFFPYLDLGDSSTLSAGDTVYSVSNPLGLERSISGGLVSYPSRVVDDPAYPCIQVTTPIASGSSGGPLLNAYGEVVGILFASYTHGQNLNLAVPINVLSSLTKQGNGSSLSEVFAAEQEKKDNASLFIVGETEVILSVGELMDIEIGSDYPGSPGMRFEIEDDDIVGCMWNDYVTRQSIGATIAGREAGSTVIRFYFSGGGNPDAFTELHVTVTE